MRDEICEAIQGMKLVEFNYDGLHRVVEPHTFGATTKGNDALSGYQTRGRSNSNLPNWKLFTLDKISGLIVLGETFDGAEAGYSRGDSRMTRIYCEL